MIRDTNNSTLGIVITVGLGECWHLRKTAETQEAVMISSYRFELAMCETTLVVRVDVNWGISKVLTCYHDGREIRLTDKERDDLIDRLKAKYPNYLDML